jgi:hypothetical protein
MFGVFPLRTGSSRGVKQNPLPAVDWPHLAADAINQMVDRRRHWATTSTVSKARYRGFVSRCTVGVPLLDEALNMN